MKLIKLMMLSGMTVLSGCSLVGGSSDYGCRGMPDSVTCMSVPEVYELTSGDDYREKVQEVSKQQMSGKYKGKKESGSTTEQNVTAGIPGQYVPVPAVTANPQPVRTPSQVMRILVYPYESSDGDLIVPGYIYTEIEPRRWEVGVRPSSSGSALLLSPLVMPHKAEAAAPDQLKQEKKPEAGKKKKKVKTLF